ncbi:hypothetical protein DDB_G0267284 [Dictyostelium discoideum AX4]|uniref:Uncharacterized protein n=1 Tax=Dictyostelium discoideum TaxID=44689 RepID=Q55H14_DICDI|nr:hypothetical protein DDB_G0267284 [Dictyostelium discoideum AX4]EAL73810.1 hypothetical protein DDB_G0267284 [Dictyostelium discoideum AX4]|eukprot:XP_647735.1 hypothetical protein DDB_G0267284 [Dictyostelium discoideum AX4]
MRSAANNLGGTKACHLRELFTIGFSGSRQTGKTRWLIEYAIRNPNVLVVVFNLYFKRALLQ